MDSQAQLQRTTHAHRQAEAPISINHPEEEEHQGKGPAKIVKKVKEKAKKIKNALTKHGHGHSDEHDRKEHIPNDHDLDNNDNDHDLDDNDHDLDDNDKDNDGAPGTGTFRGMEEPVKYSSKVSGVSEKEERRGAATPNTPVSLRSVSDGDQRRPRGVEEDQLGLGRDLKKGNPDSGAEEPTSFTNKVAGMMNPVYEKVKETGTTVMTKLPFSQQVQDKGVSAKEYLSEKLSPGEEDKVLSEVVTEKLHIGGGGGEKKGIVTQSEEVEKRLGRFSDQSSEAERKHGEAFAEEGEGGMVEKLQGAVTAWISGTSEEVTQKSTESSSQSLASTIGNMGPGGDSGDQNSGSVPLQKRFQ